MSKAAAQQDRGRGSRPAVALLLLLAFLLNTLAACSNSPTPEVISAISPTAASPTPSTTPTVPSPTPSLTPSQTASPTVLVAPTTKPGLKTRTPTPSVTPSSTPSRTPTLTWTPSPSPTLTPSATPTWTNTPLPPGPTITPTQTITPGVGPVFPSRPTPVPTLALSQDIVHVLLIGADSSKYVKDQNTDTLIVAAINRDTRQVSLLSIPRDLWVYIPTYGWGRINTAHRVGHSHGYPGKGPALLMRTIEESFGIPIDHWVRIDFKGFARVVDELGGVQMIVPCPVNLRYMPPTSADEEEMFLAPGVHHMDGATALRYVRTRRGGSDFDRAPRQQQFLKAVWRQLKSPDLLLKIPGLWSALRGSFQTDLKLGDVLALAPVALELRPDRIRSRYIGAGHVLGWTTPGGARVQLPQNDRIQQLIAGLYAPPSVEKDGAAREGARIQVWNGTRRAQLALIAADQLRWHGLNVVEAVPARETGQQQTQIIVFREEPETLDLLVKLLKIKPKNVVRLVDPGQPASTTAADLRVILGEDYDPCR